MGLRNRIKHAINAFRNNRDPTFQYRDVGMSYAYRPDRFRYTRGNERSIVTSIFNRIAVDAAAVDIRHVKLDENGRYLSDYKSGLNNCLTVEANIDQSARAFMQDVYASALDEGCIAIVPIDTDDDPNLTDSFDILTLRTGKILEWRPAHVKVRVYNDITGQKEDIWMPKQSVGIFENPFYAVMNEPSSTMQRLTRKLNLLDAIDEQSGSGKLDLIIQLPYAIKSDIKRQQADKRRADLESQLANSKYGVAYTDSTERVTQLNRPVENNLMKQIEYLTSMLYSQLSITQSIMDGTADESTMLNYNNRTIVPFVLGFIEEMKRKFLTKTARSQGQSIMHFSDPFKLVPASAMAEIGDKYVRNKILTSNEVRQIIGIKPSTDPDADRLVNPNIRENETSQKPKLVENVTEKSKEGGENQNGEL